MPLTDLTPSDASSIVQDLEKLNSKEFDIPTLRHRQEIIDKLSLIARQYVSPERTHDPD